MTCSHLFVNYAALAGELPLVTSFRNFDGGANRGERRRDKNALFKFEDSKLKCGIEGIEIKVEGRTKRMIVWYAAEESVVCLAIKIPLCERVERDSTLWRMTNGHDSGVKLLAVGRLGEIVVGQPNGFGEEPRTGIVLHRLDTLQEATHPEICEVSRCPICLMIEN